MALIDSSGIISVEALNAAILADLLVRVVYCLWPLGYSLVEERIARLLTRMLSKRLPNPDFSSLATTAFHATAGI